MSESEKQKLQQSGIVYNDSQIKEDRFNENWNMFQDFKNNRNQSIRFFNKNGVSRNIIDYVRDSVDRMNEYHLKPEHKEDWQNNVFDPITRDKLITILSKLASTRMKPELLVKPRSIFTTAGTKERKQVLSDLLEAANIKNDDESQLVWEMYTAMSEGTVFGFESWKKNARKVKYVKSYDPDTGEKEYEEIKINDWDDVFGDIIPIDEFYPETIWVRNVKKLNRAFWVRNIKMSQFKSDYGHFPGAEDVKPAKAIREISDLPWGISQDVKDDEVQLMIKFDKIEDEMGIWANGKELYYGPMPWNHKQLPIWSSQFEMIHHSFLYGKSLPDKLMGMQDVDNGLFNGMLDQLFIGLNSPIVVDGSLDDFSEGYLEPNRVYEGSQGARVQRVDLGGLDPTSFQMLSLIKRNMEEASISAQASGVPTGGRKTKFEVQQLQEGALTLASLFLQMTERAIAHKYWLRVHNLIQYYCMPSQVDSDNLKFKFITLKDTTLTNGKKGTKMIQIVGSQSESLPVEQLQEIASREENKPFDVMESRVEPIVITRDWLMNKNFDLEIKIVPNSSIKESAIEKVNKDLAFAQFAFGRPDLFNQEIAAKNFAEGFDQPEEVVQIKVQPQQTDEQSGLAGGMGRKGLPAPGANTVPDMSLL